MKVNKIMLSIYTNDDRVLRVSLDSIIIYLAILIVAAPYVLLGVSALTVHAPKYVKTEATPIRKVATVNVTKQEVKVSSAATAKPFRYKYSELKVTPSNSKIDVNFILSKKVSDGKLASGIVYVEAIANDGSVISTSTKSNFKFQTARVSKFILDLPAAVNAKALRLKVIEEGSETATSIGL
jgi:hypothetical protein